MRYQKGVSMLMVICGGFTIGVILLLAMKILPAYSEANAIHKGVKTHAEKMGGQTIEQIRALWYKVADVDNITAVEGKDLIISKKNNKLVIAYKYEKKMPLFANVSLVMDFEGSSEDQ